MEFGGWGEGAIINPRYRRSAVLRSLHEILAGHLEVDRAESSEREDPADTRDRERTPEGGEEDESAGRLRITDVQRNI
jgi:hypothetical protein